LVAIALAGLAAGTINTVVGSGTLSTFPVLLAFGYAPVTANVSNTIGLVPGSVSGAIGYRRELAGQGSRALPLGTMSVAGGITGAVLLLVLPASAFKAIVPVFIAVALVLTVLQPRLAALLLRREIDLERRRAGAATSIAVYFTGVYGGYFGAAQGILLLAILGVALAQDLQRTNALKNVLAGLVNGVAGAHRRGGHLCDRASAGVGQRAGRSDVIKQSGVSDARAKAGRGGRTGDLRHHRRSRQEDDAALSLPAGEAGPSGLPNRGRGRGGLDGRAPARARARSDRGSGGDAGR